MVGIIPMLAAGVVDEAMLDRVAERRQAASPSSWTGRGCDDREQLAELGLAAGRARDTGSCCSASSASTGSSGCSSKLFDAAEFLSPLRAARAVRLPPGAPLRARGRRACARRSTTSPPSRPPRCSAATPTGAGRCGSRSTTWSSARWSATTGSSATTTPSSTRPGPARQLPLDAIAADLRGAAGVDLPGRARTGGGRASAGSSGCRTTRRWKDNLTFTEYFHGDNGAGLGAAHQTGWTGLVADLIRRRHGAVPSIGDLLRAPAATDAHERPAATRAARPGSWFPLGATAGDGGTNFAVASGVADGDAAVPVRRARARRPGSRCRSTTPGCGTGSCRASAPGRPTATGSTGPYDPARGLRCNPAKLLLDPYARAIDGEVRFGPEVLGHDADDPDQPSTLDSAAHVPRSLVVDPAFDWTRPSPPSAAGTPTRSSTRCTSRGSPRRTRTSRRSSAAPTPGWPRGRARPPARPRASPPSSCSRCTTTCPRPFLPDRGLTNYWGYNTIGYFAPHAGYSAAVRAGRPGRPGRRVPGDGRRPARAPAWRSLLDVVFNHTAEGDHHGPDAVPPRHSTTPPTTGSTRTTPAATSTRPAAATRSTRPTRWPCR